MKVKNYIIENYQVFMDQLEKELCQNNISYVRIDNEIHFLDKIIRFYESHIEMMLAWGHLYLENNEEIDLIPVFYELNTNFYRKDKVYHKPNDDSEKENLKTKTYQSRSKYLKKQESYLVKQKLKRYNKK